MGRCPCVASGFDGGACQGTISGCEGICCAIDPLCENRSIFLGFVLRVPWIKERTKELHEELGMNPRRAILMKTKDISFECTIRAWQFFCD